MKKQSTTPKTVVVIARIAWKADARKVCYLVRSSDGVSQYETCLFDGKACSCNCKATKPCYHMKGVEAKEAARQVAWVRMPNGTQRLAHQVNDACLDSLNEMTEQYAEAKTEREVALAKAREESAAYLAQIEREVLASIESEKAQAERPRSEQAQIADLGYITHVAPAGQTVVVPVTKAHAFAEMKNKYDIRSAVVGKLDEAKRRQSAPLAGASRGFSLLK